MGDTAHFWPRFAHVHIHNLMPTVEHLLLECPIRAPHLRMGYSDWTLQQQVFHCWHQVMCTLQQGKCYLINDNKQEYSACWNGNEFTVCPMCPYPTETALCFESLYLYYGVNLLFKTIFLFFCSGFVEIIRIFRV
jgi:hypothetical protein